MIKLLKIYLLAITVAINIPCLNGMDKPEELVTVEKSAMSITKSLLKQYSEAIGISKEEITSPSLEALRLIVNRHVTAIPYQNFGIFCDKKASNLSLTSLQYRLLVRREGGACYETSELLFNVLSTIGYNVRRIPAFPLNNKLFNPSIPSSHNILLVNIDSNAYLVDVGYGNNNLKYSVKFGFTETEEQEVFTNEKYQLVCASDHSQLNLQIKGEWASLYRFNRPLQFIDLAQTMINFQGMFTCQERLPIRDVCVKAFILTADGRIGFYVEPSKGMSSAYMFIDRAGEISKKFYKDPKEFVDVIFKSAGLRAPASLLAIKPAKDESEDSK